jgi:NNP family nitrate/nitrite transporter-like MFS transporter
MSSASSSRLEYLSFSERYRILHLSWLAFFVSFVVWFNHAPLMVSIRETFQLTPEQVGAILVLNVALTIPARIAVGVLVDRIGPRLSYSGILVVSGLLCLLFAFATSFEMLALARFLLGFVGAGFVVGIRMISEWFPARQMGLAQGVYAGLGNFGSAAAAFLMPALAAAIGGAVSWRYAIAITSVMAIVYGVIYYLSVTDTPKGSTYFSPKKTGAMEVTSRGDFVLYILVQAPMFLALGVLAWQLGFGKLRLLSDSATYAAWGVLAALYLYQVQQIWRINRQIFTEPVPEIHRYRFAQVAVLCLMYFVSFGGELAVVSMLPLYFKDTFQLSLQHAGLVGGLFAGTAFFTRPLGGWLSDKIGRKTALLIVLAGMVAGYSAMSTMDTDKGLWYAIPVMLATSVFVNGANGTVYAVLPIIKRRLTGQIAGIAGAYGNVGSVVFLLILSFTAPAWLFLSVAASAAVTLLLVLMFFREPQGAIAEVLPDGSVTMIEVR